MNDHEQLSDLIDDDFEAAPTRVFPRSMGYSYPPVALAPPPAPKKKSNAPLLAVVLGMTAVFGLAALAGAGFLLRDRLAKAHADDPTAAATSTTSDTVTATDTATPTPTAAATVAATVAIEPLAVPSAAHEHASHAAPIHRGSGALQTFAIGRGKTIWVDGRAAGVGGTHVKVACGRHTIAVGAAKARTYEVPCNGGLVTVGTPDGT